MIQSSNDEQPTIFTIGHSNHPLETFLDLLRGRQIEVLVDTRSSPYSRFASHFNAEALKQSTTEIGIRYVYMGKELGGRPEGEEFYDGEGYVLYGKVAETPLFREGIDRLLKGISRYRVALLCSEEDPGGCHRRRLIGRVLKEKGIQILHIRAGGRLQPEEDLLEEERQDSPQLSLFEEELEWKSIQSVLPRKQPPSSLGS